jgi:toxin ParE1/3/4
MPKEPRRVVWAPKAKQDLRGIWRYFARVASPDIADNLLRDIDRTANALKDRALQWRARDDVLPGLRSARAHPYTIFYRVADAGVEIVRVLHRRRNFPAIFSKGRR